MKSKSEIFTAIVLTFVLIGSSCNTTVPSLSTDKCMEILKRIENINTLYEGGYFIDAYSEISVEANNRLYSEYYVRINEWTSQLVNENSKVISIPYDDNNYMDMPFSTIEELKRFTEKYCTKNYAEKYIYSRYFENNPICIESDGKLLWTLTDFINPYYPNYETLTVNNNGDGTYNISMKMQHSIFEEDNYTVNYQIVMDNKVWKFNSVNIIDSSTNIE